MDARVAGLVAAAAVAAGAGGCKTVECGANTIEQDNTCVAQEVTDPTLECGPGTVYNKDTARCENVLFLDGGGLCGSNTTLVINDAGVRTCVGTGGGTTSDCSQPLPCPGPSSQAVSLCGRVFDLEDSKALDDGVASNGEPYKAIELRVYDPLAFVSGNPTVVAKTAPDSCGRFAMIDVPLPGTFTGFIAVATDDITNDHGTQPDDYVLTGIAAATTKGGTVAGMRAFVFRRTTDASWSTMAGLKNGDTFGKLGVYIPIFLSGPTPAGPFPASPTTGVQVAVVSGSGTRTANPANDYYFDDTDPLTRKTVSTTRNDTGPNGTGLYLNADFTTYSGIGNSGAGLCWRKDLAAGPAGAAYVQERNPGAQFCP